MPDAKSILSELKRKGSEKARSTYARHGMAAERTFGVSVAELKVLAKQLKGQQAVALELYNSGMIEAMYLAGMVADGAKMMRSQLKQWADGAAGFSMISEHTVPW
jgi:3-methyladenine DNA glycosylase AlkD